MTWKEWNVRHKIYDVSNNSKHVLKLAECASIEELVSQPDLAFSIFSWTENQKLGNRLVQRYKDDPERHHQAYFVSVKLNMPIERKFAPIPEIWTPSTNTGFNLAKSEEEYNVNLFPQDGLHWLSNQGYGDSDLENWWDNCARSLEERD